MDNTWYPLLLSASLKDYLWGGSRLKNEFGFSDAQGNVAEAWVFSCHKNGESVIQNGPLAGKRLLEGIEAFGSDCLGKSAERFPYFPILIKLIDAKEKLSLQVHPDDAYALAHEGEYGKTEMWYVVDCEPEAKLIYGLKHSVEKMS